MAVYHSNNNRKEVARAWCFAAPWSRLGKFRRGSKCYLVMARSGMQQLLDRSSNWRQRAFF